MKTNYVRERCKQKRKKKLTSVSFMYVCVAGNGEMLVNVGEMCKGKTNTC